MSGYAEYFENISEFFMMLKFLSLHLFTILVNTFLESLPGSFRNISSALLIKRANI